MPRIPNVSIVIPTYNDATYVERLLAALCLQNYPSFEVIVSDAGSKDGTDEIVTNFKDRLQIKLIESPPKGPGAGRNVGAKLARGEWLLFLDADVDIDDPEFISKIVSITKAKDWQSSSTIMRVKDASIIERLSTYLNYQYTKLLSHTKHPVSAGWCILTKRVLFEANSGFNENIQFGEDYDYVTRVGKHGFGYIEDTYYYLDLRRPRAAGMLGIPFAIKGIANELYRHTHHYNLDKNPIKYEFGKHQKRKS